MPRTNVACFVCKVGLWLVPLIIGVDIMRHAITDWSADFEILTQANSQSNLSDLRIYCAHPQHKHGTQFGVAYRNFERVNYPLSLMAE
ncbi:hypothetical protein CEXT_40421 [Caerostris extrusa]|uniref:Uncharacterized protein n=1 Tax=Caerostris extrusa TaxID=172846 RepID=A0AAV4YAK5_CAEEX|nr:hypothetical protein CEXT_40421 [Caerostris extrusa]